ncbi:hypothetical protein [Oryzomonas rubra]|uniref:Uncharacterized protein n=1 Tax=Oryzomonas rubra TaxID=2509454 RepID=A0A5A9X8J1_9BACT|nr:hypothetical protein [Oryzomonas rubra]KAA0888808.1 hypothetical protein ET418_15625 [Oryzomonas rubra]
MRDYGKLHTSFWTSIDIKGLSDDGKLLAVYLLTCPHTNLIGCFRLPDGYVSEDLDWPSERVTKGFTELSAKGFVKRCPTTKWVLISKFIKWNEIENPNQAKSAAKLFTQIPDSTPLKRLAAVALSTFTNKVDRSVLEPFLNPCETLSEPFLNQEQEQEQEQETFASPPSASPPAAPRSRSHAVKEGSADHKRFTRWWCWSFEKLYGDAYHYSGKDAAHIKSLLAIYPISRLVAYAAYLLVVDDAWFVEHGVSLGNLVSGVNRIVSRKIDWIQITEQARDRGIVPPDGVKFEDWKFWENVSDQP